MLALLSKHPSNSSELHPVSINTTTRRKYARIGLAEVTDLPISSTSERIVFRVILEPLIMGVLPVSVQPIVLAIVLLGVLASLAVPQINRSLGQLAVKAREEIASSKEE